MKKVLLAVLVCLLLGVCGTVQAGQKVVGFSNRGMTGPFFAALSEWVEKEGVKAGYKMIVTDAQTNFTKQIADVEDMLVSGIDYLIVNPQDPKAGLQIVKRANEAGVPVIIVDSLLDDNAKVVTRIFSGNYAGSVLIGDYAAEVAGDTPIKLALVSFMQGNIGCMDRRIGFMTGILEWQLRNHGNADLEVLMQTWAMSTDEGGMKSMEDIITAHPEVNMVFTEASAHLKGMLNAIRAAGRTDIKVFSFDGAKFEYDAIKNGQIYATGENSPRKLAEIAIDVINRYEAGERNFPSNMSPKPLMVNKKNVDEIYDYGF